VKPRISALVAAVGGLALVLTACSGGGGSSDGASQDPNAEVKFWSFTGIGAKEGLKEYEAKQPDAKIKLSEVGSTTETATALTAALAGGEVPDLVMIQNDDLPKFVENPSNFVDLRTLGGDDIADDYLDWATSFATAKDGSVIGIPTDVGGLGLAYRADLFEAAGLPSEPADVAAAWSTWDDFIAMGKTYTAATGKPFVDNVETTVFFSTVNQVDEKYYTDDGELIYDTNPEVKEAFQVAVDTYEAGIGADIAAWSSGWDPGRANGSFAVTVAPSWMLSQIKNAAPDTAGKWRVTTVPGVGGNWGGSVIAITARAENKAGAWQYIKTMMDPEAQAEHFAKTGTFPGAKAALTSDAVLSHTDDFFGDSPIGKVMSDSVLQYKSSYNGPDTGAIGTGLLNALADMQTGNIPPGDAWETGLKNVREAIGS
jgi:cellobiose transport system substrate-binding protein